MQTIIAPQFVEDKTLTTSIVGLRAAMVRKESGIFQHSVQVAKIVKLFCKYTTLTARQAYLLQFGATIHDIGKYHPEILPWMEKEGCTYSYGEYRVIQPRVAPHVVLGWEQLWAMDSFLCNYLTMKVENPLNQDYWFVIYAIEQHHENWDGSGYPAGLSGKDIHPAGRILRYCDSLETLLARKKVSVRQAYQDIANKAGREYDPGLLPAFEAVCEEIIKKRSL